MIEIPIPNDGLSPEIELSAKLDGKNYTFRFLYSQRRERWAVTMTAPQNATPIFEGRTVVQDFPLLLGNVHAARPAGSLVFIASDASGADPTLLDLGNRVRLYYFTAADFA